MIPKGLYVPHSWHLGNDVVDLTNPRCRGKADDVRFLQRVFSEEEQGAILGSPDPDSTLWVLWAGKEAIYKSASKARGSPPVFNHALFSVTVSAEETRDGGEDALANEMTPEIGGPGSVLAGEGHYEELLFSLRVFVTPVSTHAVSWCRTPTPSIPPFQGGIEELPEYGPGWQEHMRRQFSEREWLCVTHEGSALTRIGARQALSSALGVPTDTLEIGCGPGLPGRRIPKVFLGAAEAEVDLSLSHHGRLQAWVFRLP